MVEASEPCCGQVFFEPQLQGHVIVVGRKEAVAIAALAQELAADRIAGLEQVGGDSHIVLGSQPAIAIAIKEDFAHVGLVVGAAGMPESTVEKDGVAPCGQYRSGAGWIAVGGAVQSVVEVAARNDVEIAAPRGGDIAEPIPYFER